MQLQELLKTKDNNFKLIRMLAACLVVYSHSFCLATGNEHSEPIAQYLGLSLGYIAVDIFFITSGLLVCKSLLTARSLTIFVLSRCLRIYPALITSVIFCCLLGLQLSKLSLGQYLSHNETQNFLIYNSSIIVGDYQMLPDVFTSAPYNRSVNGSLWTLPWELKMYLILTGFGVTYQFARKLKVAVNWLPTVIVLTALICLMLFMTS
ncbi:acyltransferase family protein [Agarivorans sp. Z349TD_8]|uniref:acyltransferase family protein n=1 Tax=Agarivorans sp. Z349TD_8 TaxID=3421434 RepID=UPI003D7D4B53